MQSVKLKYNRKTAYSKYKKMEKCIRWQTQKLGSKQNYCVSSARNCEQTKKHRKKPMCPKCQKIMLQYAHLAYFICSLYLTNCEVEKEGENRRNKENEWTNAPLNYGKSRNFANEFLLPMGICRVNNRTHTIETRRLFPQSVTLFFLCSSSRWYFRLLTRLPQLQLKDKRFPYGFTGRNC